MESDAVNDHEDDENEEKFEKQAQIALGAFAMNKIAQYGRVILHGFSPSGACSANTVTDRAKMKAKAKERLILFID